MSGKTLTLAVLLGGIALLAVAVSLELATRAMPARQKLWDRQELQNALLGGVDSDVIDKLGKPDWNSANLASPETPPGEALWTYHNCTQNPQTGRADSETNVWFEHGQVRCILFNTRVIPESRPAHGPSFAP